MHEEELERKDFLSDISDLFASKAPTRQFGSSTDGDTEEKKKKMELKVLDGKSAQNLCKISFDFYCHTISSIVITAKTKLDESFPTNHCQIDGYMPPIRADRNFNEGGRMIYIREGVHARQIPTANSASKDNEAKVIKIDLHFEWLVFGIYRPPLQLEAFFLGESSKNVQPYCEKYQYFLVVEDFNLN